MVYLYRVYFSLRTSNWTSIRDAQEIHLSDTKNICFDSFSRIQFSWIYSVEFDLVCLVHVRFVGSIWIVKFGSNCAWKMKYSRPPGSFKLKVSESKEIFENRTKLGIDWRPYNWKKNFLAETVSEGFWWQLAFAQKHEFAIEKFEIPTYRKV